MAALGALKPVQLAYHVPDPIAAAEAYSRSFGWGPFFVMEHIKLERSLYRGMPMPFDHTSAYGQAGDLMIELIAQHNEGPSALRDMFAPQDTGLHHVACFVDDLPGTLQEFRSRSVSIALEARTTTGVDFAMIDLTASLGHMLEVYEPGDGLRGFYAHVRKCAQGWDGSRPVRMLRG